MPAQELTRRPQASAETVEDLVARVMRGEVRVPRFQRGLKWKSKDVVDLFDSIYRGFPIGALLLRTGDAEAAEIPVGPLRVVGEELPAAWWVVDGQQRLTALAVGLARPLPVPVSPAAQDPWVVFFDPDDHSFHGPRGGDLPSRWIPLPLLLDASRLQEWMMEWAHRDDTAARKAVFEAGKRLREYRVPIYVIDTDDEAVLRSIFHRVNNTGQSLTWPEVHDALYGHRGPEPSSIAELSDRLAEVGAGRPDEDHLVSCLLAYRGQDVTRSLGELLRDKPDLLDGAAAEAMPALREVIGFLRSRAEIPHLRLLPYSTPLVVLTRFFQQHPAPSERSLMLLVRWVWRSLLVANHDDRALKRQGVARIQPDEESSVQGLLSLVPRQQSPFELASRFDARSANSRIALLAMCALRPRALPGEDPIDVAVEIRAHDVAAFRPLFPLVGEATSSPANRLLLPGAGAASTLLRRFIANVGVDHAVLRSHAISAAVAQAILDDDRARALAARADILTRSVATIGDRLAGWGRNDRPSIQYLLELGADP